MAKKNIHPLEKLWIYTHKTNGTAATFECLKNLSYQTWSEASLRQELIPLKNIYVGLESWKVTMG